MVALVGMVSWVIVPLRVMVVVGMVGAIHPGGPVR